MRRLEIEAQLSGGGVVTPLRADRLEFAPGLAVPGARMRFDRNEEIFGEGEDAEHVYRVITGAVRVIRITHEGRRQILAFHHEGDVFGLEFGSVYSLSAEAVTPCDIMVVRRSAFDRTAAESLAAARAVMQLMADQLSSARELALVLGRKGAGERVAAFLLHLSERFACRGELDLPMSRADIADHLGLTIETVSRAFTAMERDHAIALPTARHVVVCNRAALLDLEAA